MEAPEGLNPETFRSAWDDPDGAMLALDAIAAESRLLDFVRLTWSVIEPSQPYVHGWVIERICEHLEAVTRGEITRLVVNVPPGCMKSLLFNVFWPAWEWGPLARPATRYISAAYVDALTIRDNRRCRNLISSEMFQRLWGDRFALDPGQNTKTRFDNDHTGFRIATSVGGLGTGERANRFIIDDPHNVKDVESQAIREAALQWFSEVVPTRLSQPKSDVIACIMQRTHSSDVSGLILARELGYEWLCLPMEFEKKNRSFTSVPRKGFTPVEMRLVTIAGEAIPRWVAADAQVEHALREMKPRAVYPQDDRTEEGELLWSERFPGDYLENQLKPELRSWGGTYAEAGQLQQRPAPRGGGMFKREDFKIVETLPEGWGATVRGWDLAAGDEDTRSSWSVGVKMKRCGTLLVITDVIRLKGDPGVVEEAIVRTAKQDGALVNISIPQDPGQAGKAQVRHFASKLGGFLTHFSPETGEKSVRVRPLAAEAEAGNVRLLRAPWNDILIAEFTSFPVGDFSDQVDAAGRAYARLLTVGDESSAGVSPIIVGGGR